MSDDDKKKLFGFDFGDVIATLGGAALAHFIIEKEVDGKKVREINPKTLRREAPHFVKEMKDEAQFARLMNKLPPELQKALNEQWLPSLGNHQKSDVILSFAEMTVNPEGGQTSENIAQAVSFLTILGELPTNARRSQWAVSQRFMRENEDDYWIVKIMNQLKATPQQLKALGTLLATAAAAADSSVAATLMKFNSRQALGRAKARLAAARARL